MFQEGFYLLPGTELWPVSFNKRQQNEEAFFQKYSWRAARMLIPNVSQFAQREALFPVSPSQFFSFQDANYTYAARQGILTKI